MKKIWIVNLLFILIFFCGCQSQSEYKLSELEDAPNGYYILKEDTCYPLVSLDFDQQTNDLISKTIHMDSMSFLVNDADYKAIPVLTEQDQLICISNKEIETVLPLFRLKGLGYSLGLKLEEGETGSTYLLKSDQTALKEGSSIEEILSETASNVRSIKFTSIGKERIGENIISETGYIMGLKRNKNYKVTFTEGTVQKEITACADYAVLVTDPDEIFRIDKTLYTDFGFSVLTLQDSIPDGIYYLDSPDLSYGKGGLFRFKHPESAP